MVEVFGVQHTLIASQLSYLVGIDLAQYFKVGIISMLKIKEMVSGRLQSSVVYSKMFRKATSTGSMDQNLHRNLKHNMVFCSNSFPFL
jgi:hypothetical protein